MGTDFQSNFLTIFSPAHRGNQGFLHQDIHYYLARPDGAILKPAIAQDLHRPVVDQTRLPDFFGTVRIPGLY